MTSLKSPHFIHLEEASEWFAILSDESASKAERDAWQVWLEANIEHRKAWKQVESVGAMFSSFQGNSLQQSAGRVLDASGSRDISRRQMMKGVMSVAGVVSLGWFGWEQTSLPSMVASWTADFHTAVGEMSHFSLADGTKVWLNTNSALNRAASSSVRQLALVEGEALFEADDRIDARPFSVACKQAVMTSVTAKARFCLRHLSNQQAILAVYDGTVTLTPLSSGAQRKVSAGEEVVFDEQSIGHSQPALAIHESWTRGLLIVDDMALSDFIAEVGRYRHGYINLDPSIASLRVIGTYPAQDANLVFDMLESAFPIQIKRVLPWWTSISAV
ncbi:FecR domain-containing protein [Marinomonas profundimaris]|uniref:Iron dicitrate transport regulator FecR n=1 Tax=Marinomonas profundimaris TaxID=1208321 RepID=W1RWL0_9GAMM|nr:FecR domain-containing protein [Marinomonas profundimaris]ETI61347.1 iron dicitrate transport regulator FecR [Marinomonas profundimaris]